MNVHTQFEVRSFTGSWDNREYFKKLDSPRMRPRSFSSKILMGFCSDGRCEWTSQIWSPYFYPFLR